MSNSVLPGDKIAIIEEYEAGSNACDDGHVVRATVIGESEVDKKNRLVNVKNNKPISIPEKDDIVIGTVEAVMGSMIAVMIKYINSRPVKSQVECICATRNIRKKKYCFGKRSSKTQNYWAVKWGNTCYYSGARIRSIIY